VEKHRNSKKKADKMIYRIFLYETVLFVVDLTDKALRWSNSYYKI